MNFLPEDIEEYCIKYSTPPSSVCDQLESHTRSHVEMSQMLIGPLEASVLGILIHAIGAKRILEIGTYTGYSALAMAERLPPSGELITIDINPQTVELAKEFWAKSPHGNKITSWIGDARVEMEKLPGEFDLVFIDADKSGYDTYFDLALERLAPKGLIILDNMLWSGKILSKDVDHDTQCLQLLAQKISRDERLYHSLLPVRDGLMLVGRKSK